MSRMTFAVLKQKAENINRTMPDGYRLKMSQRNGYTALDLAYKLRTNFKMI